MALKRMHVSPIDRSTQNNDIKFINDITFSQIRGDFVVIRGQNRLHLCTADLVAKLFNNKNDPSSIEALRKHFPTYKMQVKLD